MTRMEAERLAIRKNIAEPSKRIHYQADFVQGNDWECAKYVGGKRTTGQC